MKTKLMLDIETLSTKPNAVVLSIAAVLFNADGTYEEALNVDLDPGEQIMWGRDVDADTVKWWLQQEQHVRSRAFAPPVVGVLKDTMYRLHELLALAEEVWAKDADFDCIILKDLSDQVVGLPGPPGSPRRWPFWKHRSVRTMQALLSPERQQWHKDTLVHAHDPLADCLSQIEVVCEAYTLIRQPEEPTAVLAHDDTSREAGPDMATWP